MDLILQMYELFFNTTTKQVIIYSNRRIIIIQLVKLHIIGQEHGKSMATSTVCSYIAT